MQAAELAERGGADQITLHVREDRRHVQDRDLHALRKTVRTRLNLEMAATPDMVRLARESRPDTCTLVPERREELTTEGGLDVAGHLDAIGRTVLSLKEAVIAVSLFIDPDRDQVQAARAVEADAIEIHTGRYCDAQGAEDRARELARVADAAGQAARLGLTVVAGHGLNYDNVLPVVAITEIEELNIGHAIVGQAIMVGMERAVRDMKALVSSPVQR